MKKSSECQSASGLACLPYAGREITMLEIVSVLWGRRLIVAVGTIAAAIFSIIYAVLQPNMYQSEVLLMPAEQNSASGLGSLATQFGGLASFAGLDFGGGQDKSTLGIEVLKSREFLSYFIEKHDLLVPLMAAKGWNREKDRLIFDNDIYDEKASVWVRDVPLPYKSKPSDQEAYEFMEELVTVNQDKVTKFVTVTFEFYSPNLAKRWLTWMVDDLNELIRSRDVEEAKKSIEFLNDQVIKTPVAEMQSIFYELIEEQTKIIMFSEARDGYVFSVIDAAFYPEKKIRPRRALICVLGTFMGGVLFCFAVLADYIFREGGGRVSGASK